MKRRHKDEPPMPNRDSSCDGKQRYGRVSARRVAKLRSENIGEKLHAYACRFCRHWHIGHGMEASR